MQHRFASYLLGILIFTLAMSAYAAKPAPWWQAETVMGTSGTLRLDDKPWWPRAKALQAGEQFVVASELAKAGEGAGPTRGLMLIRKEKIANPKYGAEMIVWILDDDGDMNEVNPAPDGDSDCYVADYNCDGVVDRVLDRIDNDGDNQPEEMEVRYFREGKLRYAWLALDLDGDHHTWFTRDYEASALYPFFRSDPYGNNLFFLNKYNDIDNTWIPFSECPFAFIDDDSDGYSERVVRFSAVPRDFLKHSDTPDYANRYNFMNGPFTDVMRDMGVMNLRYSFDIDGLSDESHPLHYEMGFNMIGDLPYKFRGMEHPNPLRREPRAVMVAPFEQIARIADSYPAAETGFSFMEFADDSIAIGDPAGDEAGDRRWEGVFWMWNRRMMHNTGGPEQFYNIRREWSGTPAKKREIYYSPVDRRLHLKGASEGWIRIGAIGNTSSTAEVHMYDSDGDGYFDRWEYYDMGTALPVRVDRVAGAKNIDFGDDWKAVQKFYTQTALPEALELDQAVIDAIVKWGPDYAAPARENYREVLKRDLSPTERRYVMDLIRDETYRVWRERMLAAQQKALDTPSKMEHAYSPGNKATERAWTIQIKLSAIDALYGEGKFGQVAAAIGELRPR